MSDATGRQGKQRVAAALLTTGIAGLAFGLEFAPALRAAIVIPYLLFVPGYMLVRLVRPGLGGLAYPAAVAVSASLLVVLAVAQVCVGIWAPPLSMALAMMTTVVAAGVTAGRPRRRMTA